MKRMTGIVALLGTVLSFGGTAFATTSSRTASTGNSRPQPVEALLTQCKTAMGGVAWESIRSLDLKGTLEVGGLSGSIDSLQDLSSGHWAGSVEAGPIRQRAGFDGKAAWRTSNNNEVSIHNPPTASDVTGIYQKAYAWWYPERWPAEIKWTGHQKSQGKTFDVLHITPQGGIPFDMWIDARTHFIARLVDVAHGDAETTSLSDYRNVHGVELPFLRQTTNDTQRRQQVTHIETASVNVPVSAEDFAPPQPGQDISVTGSADKVTLPFQFTNGYIYISVKIDGRPFRFMLDTGGQNVLSTRAAQALGIVGNGSIAVTGLGSGHVTQSYAKVKSLTLDDKITLRHQTFAIQPMQDADGAIGSGLLYGFVVRIDYAAHELTLVRPGAFNTASAGTSLPIQVRHEKPFVQASIGGVPGWFLIDTGANGFVILNTPFASKHDLYSRFHAAPPSAAGHGYNGQVVARIAHDQTFEMGPFRGQLPVFSLGTAKTGVIAAEDMAGIIGSRILKHLTMTIDYANGTVYLKPGKT